MPFLLVAALMLVSTAADAQRGGRLPRGYGFEQALSDPNSFYTPPDFRGNPPYDGRFTFARIKYRGFGRWSGREGPGWSHDYPDAEAHFTKILKEVTSMRPFTELGSIVGGAIVGLDEPALFKYPVAYLSEPGGWYPNPAEVLGLRKYLQKGGFLIVDDCPAFDGCPNFLEQMRTVFPDLQPQRMTGKEPIFDAFYKVDLRLVRTGYGENQFVAYYEHNDPKKRLLAIVNWNADVGESWQWSGRGFFPVDETNEAYKLGVNYMIYSLTHY